MRVRRVLGHGALYSLTVLIEHERLGLERRGLGGGPEAADPGGGAASFPHIAASPRRHPYLILVISEGLLLRLRR